MANSFSQCKLNILGIVGYKIVHEEDPILIEHLENCTLITISAWRNNNGGVGLVVNGFAEKALAEVIPINERIITVTFNGNPSTTVIINYTPTEGSKAAEEHYEKLTNASNKNTKHHVIIEYGDFNAQSGRGRSS